VFFALLG